MREILDGASELINVLVKGGAIKKQQKKYLREILDGASELINGLVKGA